MTDNEDLKHTAGGATTRDPMDAGVPMVAGKPNEPIGPEDALGPGKTRGDYSDRIDTGPHMKSVPIPASRREPGGPEFELVPADSDVGQVGDVAGKGGVSTAAAKSAAAALENAAPAGKPRVMRETHEDGSGRAAEPAKADADAKADKGSSSS